MFKKSLIAFVTLSAAAFAANAADITLSGRIDAGLNYHNAKKTNHESSDNFSMKSGQSSASRFTLAGSEELGNGTSVGFILENGFDSDTGAFSQEDKIFGREAIVYAFIAREVGYPDCSYFIRCYKKIKGITPKQARKIQAEKNK